MLIRPLSILLLLPVLSLAQSPETAGKGARDTLNRSIKAKGAPAWAIDTRPARRVEASLVFALGAPRTLPDEWLLYAPALAEHPAQRAVTSVGTPEAKRVDDAASPPQPLLHWRIPGDGGKKRVVGVSVTYTAELMARRLRPRSPGDGAANVPDLTDAERTAFTASAGLFDFNEPTFQTWLAENKLRPADGETEVEFARRVFLQIKVRGAFDYKPQMERRASKVCGPMKSDCGGLTAVFVATMRASGVPARQLVGRWAQSAKKDGKLAGQAWQQEHVKAEFFAAGVGWVPLDMSAAVEHDKRPGSLKYFGNDDGDLVVMHLDADAAIDVPGVGRKTVRFLQGPAYYFTGRGTLDGAKVESDWVVKPLRARSADR